jgi:competence protein ComEA
MNRAPRQWLWWLAAAVLIGVAAVHLLGGRGSPAPAPVSVAEPPARSASASAAPARKVYVHVAGRVRRPGLYRVTSGARVASAIDLAGGAARHADLTRVNLAARVEDGQQVVVPRVGAAPPGAGAAGGAGAGGAAGAKLSLGSATVEQLDGLDGIGPTLAKRIVQYREEHGGFRSIAGLRDVEGIGEKRFESLRKAVGP